MKRPGGTGARRTGAILAVAGLVAACGTSSSDPPPDFTGACRTLASRCHFYDDGGGVPHECHDLGHAAADDAVCGRELERCLAACPARDGGTSHPIDSDGGASPNWDAATPGSDASSDTGTEAEAAAVDFCVSYCSCLADTCSSYPAYPFAAPGSCSARCSTLNADERACWPIWCEMAKTGGNKKHLCEHAWGAFDLDECDQL